MTVCKWCILLELASSKKCEAIIYGSGECRIYKSCNVACRASYLFHTAYYDCHWNFMYLHCWYSLFILTVVILQSIAGLWLHGRKQDYFLDVVLIREQHDLRNAMTCGTVLDSNRPAASTATWLSGPARRSIPQPQPPVGGNPCSNAVTKPWSTFWASCTGWHLSLDFALGDAKPTEDAAPHHPDSLRLLAPSFVNKHSFKTKIF